MACRSIDEDDDDDKAIMIAVKKCELIKVLVNCILNMRGNTSSDLRQRSTCVCSVPSVKCE